MPPLQEIHGYALNKKNEKVENVNRSVSSKGKCRDEY